MSRPGSGVMWIRAPNVTWMLRRREHCVDGLAVPVVGGEPAAGQAASAPSVPEHGMRGGAVFPVWLHGLVGSSARDVRPSTVITATGSLEPAASPLGRPPVLRCCHHVSDRPNAYRLTHPHSYPLPHPAPAPHQTSTFDPYRSPARWRVRAAKINERGTVMILWGRTPRSLTRGGAEDGAGGERGTGGNAVAKRGPGGLGSGGGGGDRPGIGCAIVSMIHRIFCGTLDLPRSHMAGHPRGARVSSRPLVRCSSEFPPCGEAKGLAGMRITVRISIGGRAECQRTRGTAQECRDRLAWAGPSVSLVRFVAPEARVAEGLRGV